MTQHPRIATLVGFALLACGIQAAEPAAPLPCSLKEAVGNRFHIGAALGTDLIKGEDPIGEQLLATHFNSITPGNIMKWEHIEPKLGQFDFDLADRFVALGHAAGCS
jgi:endo-1,4-beta-xylanase